MLRLVAACAVMTLCLSGQAFGYYCSEPSAPGCPYFGSFKSDSDFRMCRTEIESYKRNVSDYVDCLDRERKEAIDAYNKAVERFNCAAEGRSFCY